MTIRKPLVVIGGATQELPSSDSIPPPPNSKTVPVATDSFLISDSAAGGELKKITLPFLKGAVDRVIHISTFGAVEDGSTNDATAINDAITAVNTAGGGRLICTPGKTIKHNSVLTLMSGVILDITCSTLLWGGGASPQIAMATTSFTENAGVIGGTINGGTTATKLLEISSAYRCMFRDLKLVSTSTTNTALDLLVNTSGTANADGNLNTVFSVFENILQDGTCGTFIRLKGYSAGGAAATSVVTLNTFNNLNSRGCYVYGIDFHSWCDSNYFCGVSRISLSPVTAASSIGVIYNSGAPTANVGVYANNFDHLAVDTFGTPASDARVGLKMNYTKDNKIGYYFQDPVAAGGDLVITSYCQSYDILHQVGGTTKLVHRIYGLSMHVTRDSAATSASWSIGSSGTTTFKGFTFSMDAAATYFYSNGVAYFGTTASQPVIFVTGGVERMRVGSGGLMNNDLPVSRAMLQDCGTVYYNSNTTNALDYVNGSHQRWAPATGAQTLSIANWPPNNNLGELLIEGVNLGAATITWPTINWVKSDGTTTTTFASNGVTLQASGIDWVRLWTRDAGVTIYGKVLR